MERNATWENIGGTSVKECRTVNEVLAKAGLDYIVKKRPVYMTDSMGKSIEIPNRQVTYRTSDMKTYDVVSNRFEVIQNEEAFDFVNTITDDIEFVNAGETYGGMVYIIGKMNPVKILGDEFTPYVLFRNGFSGRIRVTTAVTPLRMVCYNQFNFAFGGAENAVTVRHCGNAQAKLKEAHETLTLTADYMKKLDEMAKFYASRKLSKREVAKVIDRMFPVTADLGDIALKNLEKRKDSFVRAYRADDNTSFRGTAWGIINAYTDFLTHDASQNTQKAAQNRFTRLSFEKGSMNGVLDCLQVA